jgi:hypothetical protein
MSAIEIRIDDIPPSANVQRRMHWAAYAKLRRDWAWQIAATIAKRPFAEPLPFARITFTRHAPRSLDADNLAGAFKPALDVLRPATKSNPNGLGLIEDDDAAHVVVTYQQAKCHKDKAHTTIVIERGAA